MEQSKVKKIIDVFIELEIVESEITAIQRLYDHFDDNSTLVMTLRLNDEYDAVVEGLEGLFGDALIKTLLDYKKEKLKSLSDALEAM